MSNKTFEQVIAEQGRLVYTKVGNSMYPFILPRDLLVIERPTHSLRRFDIPLYKRPNGQYVLHRIVGVGDDGAFVTRGDNRTTLEYGVTEQMIIGVLTAIIRGGETLSVDEMTHRILPALSTVEVPGTPVLHRVGSALEDDSRAAKRRYLRRRVFLSDEELRRHYPTVHRHRILYPLLIPYRAAKGIFTRPRALLDEYRALRRHRRDDPKKNNPAS
jgi:hypothetical protein